MDSGKFTEKTEDVVSEVKQLGIFTSLLLEFKFCFQDHNNVFYTMQSKILAL